MSSQKSPSNTAFILPHAGGGLHTIARRTRPVPSPKAHEVLVKIHAVSLNYRDFAMSAAFYPVTRPPNRVLGSDMAGEVLEVGEGVEPEEFKKGDRVTANFSQSHIFGMPTAQSEFSFRSSVRSSFHFFSSVNCDSLSHDDCSARFRKGPR